MEVGLVYARDGKRLYEGDVRYLSLPDEDIACLLTDPPYAMNKYLRDMEEAGKLLPDRDMMWMGEVSHWVGQWWWPLRARLGDTGAGWVFANVHYVGFYLRWAHLSGLSLRGIFPCPPAEFLLAFGSEQFTQEQARVIRAACVLNTYGQNKPLALLRALISVSPPGLVCDPFAGLGSTLDAATLEARPSLGVEIRHDLVAQTIARWNGTQAATDSR